MFSCFLLVAALSHSTIELVNATHYTVNNRVPSSKGGKRFSKSMGTARAKLVMSSATSFIFHTFQQTGSDANKRKVVDSVSLSIEDIDGVAYTLNADIHVSTNYIASYREGDLDSELEGVIYHEMTHVWQWNGNGDTPTGLIEGIADYVRLKANFAPSHWVEPGEGDRWDQGYDVTARFLDYCDGFDREFVGKLNKKMRYEYKERFFKDLLGFTVDELWVKYKVKYRH
ncbi:Basic secretory protease (Fragments) [Linum grandiflorum]